MSAVPQALSNIVVPDDFGPITDEDKADALQYMKDFDTDCRSANVFLRL